MSMVLVVHGGILVGDVGEVPGQILMVLGVLEDGALLGGIKHTSRYFPRMVLHEIFAGATSSLLISPIMSILDLSIIKSQIHKEKLSKSLVDNFTFYSNHKTKFLKPLSIMNLVYTTTYCTANLTEYVCKVNHVDYRYPTLLATSSVNIITIMYKDNVYSKLLKKSKAEFPLRSTLLFGARDMMTIMTCFIWKKDAMDYLDRYIAHNKSEIITSILMPCLIQIISTPLHILAIDMYEQPNRVMMDRFKLVPSLYKTILLGRMMRAFPAFGLGGFINDMLRPVRKYELH